MKGKVYKVAVRPAMLYGLETVALTKRQEAEMEEAELKMLRFSLGVTRMDKIRNEYIRGTAQVGQFGEKTRTHAHAHTRTRAHTHTPAHQRRRSGCSCSMGRWRPTMTELTPLFTGSAGDQWSVAASFK